MGNEEILRTFVSRPRHAAIYFFIGGSDEIPLLTSGRSYMTLKGRGDAKNMISIHKAHEGQVVTLTLTRPTVHNALNLDMVEALQSIFHGLAENSAVRVVIVRGEGPHFCAGADIAHMRQEPGDGPAHEAFATQLAQLLWTLHHFPHPVLALAHGGIYGGGIGLLACCDVVLAVETSTFCFSEVKLGLIPAVISPYVVLAMGARKAKAYMLTAQAFTASQAHHMGLVHEVVAEKESEQRLTQLTECLLKGGPSAQSHVKTLIQTVSNQPLTQALVAETVQRLTAVSVSEEAQEGLSAFLEKTAPLWVQKVRET